MLNSACYRIIRLQIKVITKIRRLINTSVLMMEKALYKASLKNLKSSPMFNKTNGLDTLQTLNRGELYSLQSSVYHRLSRFWPQKSVQQCRGVLSRDTVSP